MIGFDLAQTFFIDPDGALQAPSVWITSIDLYFYAKPVEGKTKSGIYSPGVSMYVGDTTVDGVPNIASYKEDVVARVEYANINPSTDGETATTFTFSRPLNIRTGVSAAFFIKFDGKDSDFQLWYNKAGEYQLGTTTQTNVTSGKVDGSLFVITNGTQLTAQKDADLSFVLKVAKFTTAPTNFSIYNRPHEILKVYSTTGSFIGGERVYAVAANAAGTIAVSSALKTINGTGTTFTSLSAGDSFVITDGTPGNTEVVTVASVTNTTSLSVTVAPSFTNTSIRYYKTVTGRAYYNANMADYLVIQDSTANSSVYLSSQNVIYGVDSLAYTIVANITSMGVNSVVPSFVVGLPSGTTANTRIGFANTSYVYSSTREKDVVLGQRLRVTSYPATIASRTIETTTGVPFKSLQSVLTFTTLNPYTTPYVDENDLDMFIDTYAINNDDTNEYLGIGNAYSRYVSRSVSLANGQEAEDIKVYIRAYRPANTTIKTYVRFRNSHDIETLDIKNWTELTANTNANTYSSSINARNYVQIQYDVPFQPNGTKQSGTFNTSISNAVITGTSGVVNTGISVGNVVRIYSPLFANTYLIDTVVAANTTSFTIGTAVANSIMANTGFSVDVVTRKNSAYLDVQNQNILTYYNSSLAKFQGFDSFAIKIVLLSDNGYVVPRVDDVRAIALTA